MSDNSTEVHLALLYPDGSHEKLQGLTSNDIPRARQLADQRNAMAAQFKPAGQVVVVQRTRTVTFSDWTVVP